MKLNLSLLVILLMADTVWSQCRTANWRGSFRKTGWSTCDSATEYVTGFYRNDRTASDPIYLLEEARCCKAPAPNQYTASTCTNANWWVEFDRNFNWAVCPNGYFIQGLYRTQDDSRHNIEEGRCCKPTNLPSSYPHCYEDQNVRFSFNNKGWSNCDSGYYLAGIYRGGCNKLFCVDKFKCCSMYDDCKFANWWGGFDKKDWVQCDSSTHYITGLWRNTNWGYSDKIYLLEGAKCCPALSPDQNTPSTCKNTNWRTALDRTNTWAVCPNGYFVQGFYRTDGDWLSNIEEAKCCKPNTFPDRYEHCYYENVEASFDNRGLSQCKKGYYLAGIYKGGCETLYCIECFKCCKMNDINECTRRPCRNGATCVNLQGSYRCDCKSGYSGKHCETDIDECPRRPCRNGATCVNLQGSYRCDCKSGYFGKHCETDIDECPRRPCRNGAICVNLQGSYRCDCKSGYSGKHCETDIDECPRRPCRNGATCVNLQGSYRCDCKSGYSGKNCETGNVECGIKAQDSRIVGGTKAQPGAGAWPWQVTIGKGNPANHWCGGSIVAPQWIVSAAHCFKSPKDPKQYTLVAGDHDLKATDGYEQNITIEKIISHPQFVSRTYDYDVALVKLQSPLNYNNRVWPVCLPLDNFPANTTCYVTGWGATSYGGSFPQILHQAQVPLVSRNTCQAGYPDPRKTITSRMLCAGYAQGGIDSCRGDSGGPLVCPRGAKWYLTGVVSWGVGCASKGRYGVYSDVMNLKKWLQDTMKKN